MTADQETRLARLVGEILSLVGEDVSREGLARTPARVAKAYRDLTSGYHADPDAILNGALFKVEYNEMVLVKDINFYSLCEHHMLPFFGVCHVAYIPDGKVVGLSKIPKLVKAFSHRLQVQERLTSQVADILRKTIHPLGVAVVMEARHMCMEMRGAESLNSPTVTSAMRGLFQTDARTREEFLSLIGRR
jgi:GTP cyclohydrolase I